MIVTRLYSGNDGHSHFEDIDLPLKITRVGAMSSSIPMSSVFFRDTAEAGPEVWDYHVAPQRQLVIHVIGRTEIEVGSGETRRFGPGDVLLADDLTGQGHISRQIDGPRLQVFAVLEDQEGSGLFGAVP